MSDPLDPVRDALNAAEDVSIPEGLSAPHPVDQQPVEDHGYDPGPDDRGPPDRELPPGDLPPEGICAEFPLNDVGNGQRFVTHFGEDLCFVSRVGWHVWDGCRWVLDAEITKGLAPRVRALAQQMSPLIEAEVPWLRPSESQSYKLTELGRKRSDLKFLSGLPETEQADGWADEVAKLQRQVAALEKDLDGWFRSVARHLTHAKNAGNSNAMNNFANEASVTLRRDLAEMDANPMLVNTRSGVLHLTVEGGPGTGFSKTASIDLLPHARDQLITKLMPVDYAPGAMAPKFDAFLARIHPSAEMRRFLQRWFGYTMFGSTAEQALVYFYGVGANGKSVLVDLMAKVIGEYSATAKIESLTGGNRRGGGDATPDLIPLVGARFVRASEPDKGVVWNEGFIKELTGGEPMLIRALHSDFVEFLPIFKMTLSGNHEPEIRGTDDGIWRRLNIVPFEVQIPKNERIDKDDLIDDLMTEAPGILNWLCDGAIDWAENGLSPPSAVQVATQTLRDDSDPTGEFLREICLIDGDLDRWMTSRELCEAFNFWRSENGRSQWRDNTVFKAMKSKAEVWRDPATNAILSAGKRTGIEGYRGIRLRDFFKTRFENAPRDHRGRVIHARQAGGDDAPE